MRFRSNAGVGPYEIRRWLGVSLKVFFLISYWILTRSGIPIFCSTVQLLTNLEYNTDMFKITMKDYTTSANIRLEAQVAQDLPRGMGSKLETEEEIYTL